MKKLLATALLAAALILPSLSHAATVTEKQNAIQAVKNETLSKLYALHPDAEREIAAAPGYAVFSSGSLAFIWVSGGFGHGVAHNNGTGEETYMEMVTAGVGLGVGAKDYNTVFVFHTAEALQNFITNGLDLSANADAAAKVGEKGAASSGSAGILPGMRIYQITDTGLMAQAMLQGTKYWRDDELNNPAPYNTAPRPAYNN